MQLIQDNIVARLEVERVGDGVFTITGCRQKPNLPRTGVDKFGKSISDRFLLFEHRPKWNRLARLRVVELTDGFSRRPWARCNVRRIQICASFHYWKVISYPKEVTAVLSLNTLS